MLLAEEMLACWTALQQPVHVVVDLSGQRLKMRHVVFTLEGPVAAVHGLVTLQGSRDGSYCEPTREF